MELLVKNVPGSSDAIFLFAKTLLRLGETETAEAQLQLCVNKNKSNYQVICIDQAHILMSEIHIQNKNFRQALSSLEMALSFDFHIRHNSQFILLKAKCLNGLGSFEECKTAMKSAFNLPILKEAIQAIQKGSKWDKAPTEFEIASMFLALIEAQTELSDLVDKF